ncbi:MAG: XdhC family protein, partial [Pseudomonadota bacterium]
MSFDQETLAHVIATQGQVARVVIAAASGSSPREVGASMLVWESGQLGSIGGGALEFETANQARDMLAAGTEDRLDKLSLGPSLGQCCGGAVTLLTEIWTEERLAHHGNAEARPLPGEATALPRKVNACLQAAKSGFMPLCTQVLDGWIIEPQAKPDHTLWLWGAG